MAFFRPLAITFLWLLSLLPSFASATAVLPVSLSQMTEKVDTIVAGVVTDTYSYWENERIYTDATVEVLEYFKHPTALRPNQIVVKSLGGKVKDTRMDIQGGPNLSANTEVVLFLIKRQDKFTIYGLHYGLCMVEPDYAAQSQKVSGPVFRAKTTQNLSTMAYTRNPLPQYGERVDLFFQRVRDLVQKNQTTQKQ